MTEANFQELAVRDARLAPHVSSPQPAWLWALDGTGILWTNAAGAAALGLGHHPAMPAPLNPADPHRRQIEQLARILPASGAARLQRMHGFGATLGLATCACSRLDLANGGPAILVASMVNTGRPLPLSERLQFIVDGFDRPAAAFSAEGKLLVANRHARDVLGRADDLSALGLDAARIETLATGRTDTLGRDGDVSLCRTGTGRETAIVALMAPGLRKSADVRTDRVSTEGEPEEQPAEKDANDKNVAPADEPHPRLAVSEPDLPPPAVAVARATMIADAPAPATRASSVDSSQAPVTDDIAPQPRPPLRFLWQMDVEHRFSLGSDEFSKLIGPLAAAALGRPWPEIAMHFDLDPEDQVGKAIATRETWSGVVIHWPINDAGDRLPIELSGLPIYDHGRNFAGYRGFGLCRHIDQLEQLAELRRQESVFGTMHPKPTASNEPAAPGQNAGTLDYEATLDPSSASETIARTVGDEAIATPGPSNDPQAMETEAGGSSQVQQTAQNVVPFRLINDQRTPALSPVENNAFDEIARRLSERLDRAAVDDRDAEPQTILPPEAEPVSPEASAEPRDRRAEASTWFASEVQTAKATSEQDKLLLDHVPVGILIYRLDRLLYANPAFLRRVGFDSLHALSEAGGLDALYVEPVTSPGSSNSEDGMPLTIATPQSGDQPSFAKLFTISWDSEQAMALIFSPADNAQAALAQPAPADMSTTASTQLVKDDLATILDTTTDGVVLFDREGNILACNRSAESLFNESRAQLTQRNLADLFPTESQSVVLVYFESIDEARAISLMDHGREVLGQVRGGGLIPLAMTMGRTGNDGERFFAVFRDLSQTKKNEADLLRAKQQVEGAVAAKADILASINHAIRSPLNAIIGFAEGMIEQRFGPLGNERYAEYIKDIREAGERVLAIISDMVELSRIETGKLDLTPTNNSLNDIVAQRVGAMQPQANRERIIIRSSLAHHLPAVVADTTSLRQIVTNLIATSIQLASAGGGGQVIVSTALTDAGDAVLRVRDTGHSLSERDLAAAMEPRRGTVSGQPPVPDISGLNLSLAKALAEANRAQFSVRPGPHSGTLIEIIFATAAKTAASV